MTPYVSTLPRWSELQTLLLVICCVVNDGQSVEVSTTLGPIRGFSTALGDGTVLNTFLGVPFAAPPTGDLRFRPPQPQEPWTDIFDATRFGPACLQFPRAATTALHAYDPGLDGVSISEDCLNLNVYAPKVSDGDPLLPAMLYIYGGAYLFGANKMYDGSFLAQKGVIVVIPNYRLGTLGFFSTGDSSAPGNYGMLDQLEVMKWVRDNIRAFGGNPDRVTIFGQSSGAASASLHLLSPLSRDYFHQVILQSGASTSPWAVLLPEYEPQKYTDELARQTGCSTQSAQKLVGCLREKTAEEVSHADVGKPYPMLSSAWAPVVDGPGGFLPARPRDLLAMGRFTEVRLMAGCTTDERARDLANIPGVENGVSRDRFVDDLAEFVRRFPTNSDFISDALLHGYTDYESIDDPIITRDNYIQLLSDYRYIAPVEEVLLKMSAGGVSTYKYSFGYQPNPDRWPSWRGVPHAAELRFLFNITSQFVDGAPTAADMDMQDKMVTLWTNFAKTGNPTPSPVDGVTWQPFTNETRAHLMIDRPLSNGRFLQTRRMELWDNVIKKMAETDTCEKDGVTSNGHTVPTAVAMVLMASLITVKLV
ncbi:PREDICTED: cholinesterase 2-like isoform X1 [Branchiostoma belcheri]|uniref:Carboxylic ester hydrolase n=1 Tax=Branchiostoma belcheri TaxID=7741 RepID=A0A6P4ZQ00_BRABE|nr:PREDICTED: cholinesterase 2-like isoform X1 [Branchiostoma belcheri]